MQVYKIVIYLFACNLLLFAQPLQAQVIPDTTSQEEEPPVQEFTEDTLNRRTPRGTVNGFLVAVANDDYETASRFLHLEDIQDRSGEELARVLQRLLDRGGQIMPYSWIRDNVEGRQDDGLPPELDRVGTVTPGGETLDLFVERIEDEEGAPIWLFSQDTMREIAAVEIDETLLIERILPEYLQERTWSGIPVGQWLIMILLFIPAYFIAWCFIWFLKMLLKLFWAKARTETTQGIIHAFALPIRVYLAVWLYIFISQQVGISILLRQRFSGITLIIGIVAILILLWQLTNFVSTFSRRRMNLRGLVSWVSIILFLRRVIKAVIVVFGTIAILNALGYDVTTGLAALGIGGLALALGAQKTLENFIGGVSLIADQPIRVGDVCRVGDVLGKVESIGMRSTRIRTANRTVVTIPNGELTSKNIENLASRDKFLFETKLGLRYETTPEQIQFLVVKLNALLKENSFVETDSARVTFIGFGESAINLEISSFIKANDFVHFLKLREDLLVKIYIIIRDCGTDFAFPSKTLYFGQNMDFSEDKIAEIKRKVERWRDKGKLDPADLDADVE